MYSFYLPQTVAEQLLFGMCGKAGGQQRQPCGQNILSWTHASTAGPGQSYNLHTQVWIAIDPGITHIQAIRKIGVFMLLRGCIAK